MCINRERVENVENVGFIPDFDIEMSCKIRFDQHSTLKYAKQNFAIYFLCQKNRKQTEIPM